MKKIIIFYFIFIYFISCEILADASKNLRCRLNNVNSFFSNFTQKVKDSNGNNLQKNYGCLWVKYPNFFRLHIVQPNENIFVSDGKTLWFYNSYVKQVTIFCLKDFMKDSLFTLITHKKSNIFSKYDIKQYGDNFTIIPKNNFDKSNKLTININRHGVIRRFSTIELDNKENIFFLKSKKINIDDVSKFKFIIPVGVTVDDQR